jgi:hypothetical protein
MKNKINNLKTSTNSSQQTTNALPANSKSSKENSNIFRNLTFKDTIKFKP